jgi:excisionase family DNA binding protein
MPNQYHLVLVIPQISERVRRQRIHLSDDQRDFFPDGSVNVLGRSGSTWICRKAADALGVHCQTAYRWVRSGRLPARLVAGQYRVGRADLERVDDQRRKPIAPRPPSGRRLHHQVERMYEALLNGDEAEARRICQRLVGDGTRATARGRCSRHGQRRSPLAADDDGDGGAAPTNLASAELAEQTVGELRAAVIPSAVGGPGRTLDELLAAVRTAEPTRQRAAWAK